MASQPLDKVVRHLHRMLHSRREDDLTDGSLLQRYATQGDDSAFALLTERHGPRVFGVCQRVLKNRHDAEDAFQATFFVLARKAGSVARGKSLGSWLHGVAYRTALQARANAARRQRHERQFGKVFADRAGAAEESEFRGVVDAELARLPPRYRSAILLHHLEGYCIEDAARHLGCSVGQFRGALFRGRQLLQKRVLRRGLAVSSGLLGLAAKEAELSAALREFTVKAALAFAADQSAAAAMVPPAVSVLVQGVLRAMFVTRLKIVLAVVLTAGVVAWGVGGAERPYLTAQLPAEAKLTEPQPAGVPGSVSSPASKAGPAVRRELTLSRITYDLPNAKARALAALLREHGKVEVMEVQVAENTITITTTPEVQERIAQFIPVLAGLSREKPARSKNLPPEDLFDGLQPTPQASKLPPEDIRGKVTNMDQQSGLVTIDLGSDDGLSKGNTLEVYRLKPRPAYVGTLRILEVRPKEAVGKLVPSGKAAQVGDEVSSELKRP